MNFATTAAILTVAAATVSCAGHGGGASVPAVSGRYLQVEHPVSSVVAFQMAFPSQEGCAGMLATLRHKPESKELLPFFACVDTSASSALPARATLRNRTYAFVFDVEAVSVGECKSFVEGMLKSDGKENLEVVAPCAPR